MQVTIDTRHDTLEEALAVIRLALPGRVSPAGKLRRIIAARQEEDCRQEEPIIRVGKEGYGTRGEKGIT